MGFMIQPLKVVELQLDMVERCLIDIILVILMPIVLRRVYSGLMGLDTLPRKTLLEKLMVLDM